MFARTLLAASTAILLGLGAGQASARPHGPPPGPYVPVKEVVHIENIGDVKARDGIWAGTRGQGLRLEGFSLDTRLRDAYLQYTCHVQDLGDLPAPGQWYNESEFCGTRGQSRRLEALAIRVAGRDAYKYTVLYQCHLQDIGDTPFVKDGEVCGTKGESRRLEAFRLVVLRTY